VRDEVEELAVEPVDKTVLGLAEPRRTLGDHVEHRLDVGRRTADNAQDLARRRLLLERFAGSRVRLRQRLTFLLERRLRACKALAKPVDLGLGVLALGEQLGLREISCGPLPRLHVAHRAARRASQLMQRRTCDRFSWRDAEHVTGVHVNMAIVGPDPETMNDLTEFEQRSLASLGEMFEWGTGYALEQGTRPQTVGYALVDSPVGQAAWITEKYWAWTDHDGDPTSALSRDQMLDNITLYWLTATAASSARLYWESFNSSHRSEVPVPSGISIYPREIVRPSRRWCEKRYTNLRWYEELERGGGPGLLPQT